VIEQLAIGNLSFEIRRSRRRKSVGITVDRGGQLVLHAPVGCPMEKLEEVARSRRLWVYSKLAEKEALYQPPPPREYVSGEGFYYLGQSYRLLVFEPDPNEAFTPPLRFFQGRFMLRRDERLRGRDHFIGWYTVRARLWVSERLDGLARRVGVTPSGVTISDLGTRWGSCGASGAVNFHWRTIMLPADIAEYVVVHELAHLIEPRHSAAFWCCLERVIPEFAERKRWLAENGVRYVL